MFFFAILSDLKLYADNFFGFTFAKGLMKQNAVSRVNCYVLLYVKCIFSFTNACR